MNINDLNNVNGDKLVLEKVYDGGLDTFCFRSATNKTLDHLCFSSSSTFQAALKSIGVAP